MTVSMSRSGDTSPSTWLTSGSVNDPDHLADRVGLADVAEELVAQPLALRGAADQPGDVDEPHGGRDDPRRVVQLGQLGEPRVGHPDDAHVRLDGRERVVGSQRARPGQRVEQGGLADVGQPDDADRQTHLSILGAAATGTTVNLARNLAIGAAGHSFSGGRAPELERCPGGVAGPDRRRVRVDCRPRLPVLAHMSAMMLIAGLVLGILIGATIGYLYARGRIATATATCPVRPARRRSAPARPSSGPP